MNFKTAFTLCCLFMVASSLQAQELKFPDMDKSALDAATYPASAAWNNYMGDDKKDLQIRALYSRPTMKGRTIFGDLVPYGKEWRLGANEAVEVYFADAVEIGGTTLNRGYYTLFADVHPTMWVIKVSTERFIAGNENRDQSKDVASVSVPVEHVGESRESFTIGFQKVDDSNCNMLFAWDRTQVALPINFNPATMEGDDKSPMDLVQFPANSRYRNYVEEADFEASAPKIRVVYSRPQKKDRTIFGKLIKYGEPWRIGANETTEITFFQDVKIGGQDVKRGRYGIHAVVHEGKWDFVLHTDIPTWGPANHDDSKNVATFSAATEKTPSTVEALAIVLQEKGDKKVHMVIAWDNTMVQVPIEY